jgi:hypothetical protein
MKTFGRKIFVLLFLITLSNEIFWGEGTSTLPSTLTKKISPLIVPNAS